MTPVFLTREDVLALHDRSIRRFGGATGLRDLGLLESAIAQPEASFGGAFMHEDVWEMAAAYHFHLVSNHAFVDGNKRIGLLAALVFLEINGVSAAADSEALYAITMAVAEGRAEKAVVAAVLRGDASP
jgi:death-on-curing protein